ncbi:monofunctional biosynthetic peptidoglycan transglycosylase [Tritonibacter mobilis]|uniref:monofunctional biosynthetic peptidoglycan transglycosylase n=1 Tax=Tritonibacter mobilis TaxID=379347 RepID=UPI001C08B451|nr:monofunctional biosynthetic peptidoglycan transglycosylase [Tritonibacter mobilis]MBU3033089.1 monofunctional biosynthetic peptidoglycan transglycosylase [Tritonibacter mobilis]WHQ82271.1 monofunctional biosynthetic peptidoglycan transglycosylase [Tritonibacter mobilis]
MAKAVRKKKSPARSKPSRARYSPRALYLRLRRWVLRGALGGVVFLLALILLYSVVNPPITHTIWAEKRRLGDVDREWVPIEQISPNLARSVVAAEDARFCEHWGFDVNAIRNALESGANRGASTITQQVVKNVFLWQGRSWFRKALETFITPVVEATWSKKRIVEVYLNVAEMGEGVFGADAAARHYFGVGADKLSPQQAALIAALLPNPKERSAANPGNFMRKRARQIMDGAATIERDGRSACFEH